MPFEFVDNTTIDRKARKLIRSHAAKGKNVGKKHPMRGKANATRVKKTAVDCGSNAVTDTRKLQVNEEAASINVGRQINDGLSVLCFTFEVTPSSKRLVHKVFTFITVPRDPPGLHNVVSSAGAGSHMAQYVFMDEAFFYCAAAMAAAVFSSPVDQKEATEAMRHLSHTLSLINRKLSGSEALSDVSMAVVIAMIQYERLRGEYHQGLIHFQGLQRMVELRGGISQLTSNNPALAQKVLRADLEFALQLGSATRFTVGDIPTFTTCSCLQDRRKIEQQQWFCEPSFWKRLSFDIQDVFSEMLHLVWVLNHVPKHGKKPDAFTFSNTLFKIGYRLVRITPLNDPQLVCRLDNALFLGMAAFITTFLVGLGCKRFNSPLLAELIRSATEKCRGGDKEYQEILLWTLSIGSASVFNALDDGWLIPKTMEITIALGLNTCEDMLRTLSRFPWVNSVHDQSGQALWQTISLSYEPLNWIPDDLSLL